MFPNVRLMVVAILAAITGISCGLGLFAAFRVNHEPLARLAEGSPPLQLALNNRSLGSEAGAPLEARLPGKDAARLRRAPNRLQIVPARDLACDLARDLVRDLARDLARQESPERK